ncbi:ABC transporter related protein [Paludibacter propionicigenes WB4]|uniref:ABC transporter related protein n=1 Tax=Paludibacter propionicigenes (strain DSM 17365 / JCM 13257 / WB4) TaxID=694427 RepID=E4T3J8_PALPW|nr:ABC transporter ATP-binding protein [Paludibacter propionicigenes]ADQ79292.1 ABC transporter related protein [Paludibacter propionicigenes WB4]
MSTAIKFENISKQYRLGLVSTQTLSHDLNRWWKMNIQGKEDPYLKIGEVNDRAHKGESDYVWALKDINFEVQQGDVLGIIGKNGAGKSTLLKILSKVTAPTTGTIKAAGRIASLLEVGTGFHPEMTGRENIYMNGVIMGMTKAEITRKLDEIVDFSGVERYLDTPVKRYSSGMTVRLGFAIAAHLEPEILVVDEVLAVGDAEFQKKAIGKMQDVSKGEGRTVLFVSHNLHAVANLCQTGIVLKNGYIYYNGSASDAISVYNSDKENLMSKKLKVYKEGKKVWFVNLDITNKTDKVLQTYSSALFSVEIESLEDINDVYLGIGINNINDIRVFTLFSKFLNKKYNLKKGINKIVCSVDSLQLKPGEYLIELFIGTEYITLDYYKDPLFFEILMPANINVILPDQSQGDFLIQQNWL